VSPSAKGGGYANSIHYTHGSTLRTIQEIFGVTPLLGDAANATDLTTSSSPSHKAATLRARRRRELERLGRGLS